MQEQGGELPACGDEVSRGAGSGGHGVMRGAACTSCGRIVGYLELSEGGDAAAPQGLDSSTLLTLILTAPHLQVRHKSYFFGTSPAKSADPAHVPAPEFRAKSADLPKCNHAIN